MGTCTLRVVVVLIKLGSVSVYCDSSKQSFKNSIRLYTFKCTRNLPKAVTPKEDKIGFQDKW